MQAQSRPDVVTIERRYRKQVEEGYRRTDETHEGDDGVDWWNVRVAETKTQKYDRSRDIELRENTTQSDRGVIAFRFWLFKNASSVEWVKLNTQNRAVSPDGHVVVSELMNEQKPEIRTHGCNAGERTFEHGDREQE